MGYGKQFPGSATLEEPPVEPKGPSTTDLVEPRGPSTTDLCASCLAADTCTVAVNKGLVAGSAGGAPDAILVARCPFYLAPADDPT